MRFSLIRLDDEGCWEAALLDDGQVVGDVHRGGYTDVGRWLLGEGITLDELPAMMRFELDQPAPRPRRELTITFPCPCGEENRFDTHPGVSAHDITGRIGVWCRGCGDHTGHVLLWLDRSGRRVA